MALRAEGSNKAHGRWPTRSTAAFREGTEDQRTVIPMSLPETKILEAIFELNNCMLVMRKPEERAILRGLIENLRRALVTLLESLFVFNDDEFSAVPNGQSIRDTIDEARASALAFVRSIRIYSEDDVRLATSCQGRWELVRRRKCLEPT